MSFGTLRHAASTGAIAVALGLLAASTATAASVAERDMLKYCQGEASGRFKANPRDIEMKTLNDRPNGAKLAHGTYSDAGGKKVSFACRFRPNGEFLWVRTEDEMSTIKDNEEEAAESFGGPSSRQVQACNAVEDRYGKVVESNALKPGAWEIILEYDDGAYVCNVDDRNKVTYFEKLK